MSVTRPIESAARIDVSATLPINNAGNADLHTGGAGVVIYEVEAVDGLVVKAYAKSVASGTWRKVVSYQQANESTTKTERLPDASITLVAGDQIIVPALGFYEVRLARVSGTSATLVPRTADDLGAVVAVAGGEVTASVDFGTKINAATLEAGGEGNLGWLSQIAYLLGLFQDRDNTTQNVVTLSNTDETTVLAAVASVYQDLVSICIRNPSPDTPAVVTLRDDESTGVSYAWPCPFGVPVGIVYQVPLKQTAVNKKWTAQSDLAGVQVELVAIKRA